MEKKGHFPPNFREKFAQLKKENEEKDGEFIKLNKKILNLERMITKLKSKF